MSDEIEPEEKKVDAPVVIDPKPSDEEVKKAQLQKDLGELEAAKVAASAELQRIRADKRAEKKDKPVPVVPAPEQELTIDENDPNAKAWLKKIQTSVSPMVEELEKEKTEIRSFAISRFLASKPSLAKNPEKLKELMAVYDRSHTASERTVEGVEMDLEKAYAYTHSSELLEAARQTRVDEARKSAIFADIAVSRGSTGYAAPQESTKVYSEEEKAILARWEQSTSFPKIEEKKSSKA